MNRQMYIRLSTLQFLQYFVWGSWFVTAGTYLLNTLHFSGREVGLVYANNAIAATFTPFILGVIADRYFPIEKMLIFLHLLGGVLLWTLSKSTEFSLFYPLIMAYVLCYSPTFSLSNALCFHHINDSKSDFPRIRVWGTIGWISAGLVVGLYQWENTVIPFRMAAITSIILSFYSMTLPHTPPVKRPKTTWIETFFSAELRKLFKDRSFVILVGAVGLICIPSSYYYSFTNPFLNEMEVTNSAGKMSIGQGTEVILMLMLPLIFNKMRMKYIVFIGLFTWGFRYGLYILGILTDSEWLYIAGILLHGIAFIFSVLSAQIYIDTRAPQHLRSTAQGFFSFLTLGFGAFIGTYIAGEMVHQFTRTDGSHDWISIWLLPTIVGMVVSFFFLFLFKSKEKA